MLAVGMIYMTYQVVSEMIDATEQKDQKPEIMPGIIFGAQVGLVALSMIVTWDSVITLRAREGLGSGNLYVGWFTLGKNPVREHLLTTNEYSGIIVPSICVLTSSQQALSPAPSCHLPSIRTHLHHPHHLLRRPILLRLLPLHLQLDASRAQSLPVHVHLAKHQAHEHHNPPRARYRRGLRAPYRPPQRRLPRPHPRRRPHRSLFLLLHPIRLLQRLQHRLCLLLLPRRRLPPRPRL